VTAIIAHAATESELIARAATTKRVKTELKSAETELETELNVRTELKANNSFDAPLTEQSVRQNSGVDSRARLLVERGSAPEWRPRR